MEGVAAVYHILPGLFHGELSVEGGEGLYWSFLFYLARVDVGEPLLNSVHKDWFDKLSEELVDDFG